MSLFEQYPLFAPDLSGPQTEEAGASTGGKKAQKKSRTYDLPVLKWVAYHRVVTVHQVVYRFFVYAGRGPGYGFRIVQGLVQRGLLESSSLDTERGSVSRQILTVSEAGWAALCEAVPKDKKRVGVEGLREYRIQFAEMMMVRELEGWSLISAGGVWKKLKDWSLEQYRGRTLTDTERATRTGLERAPAQEVGLNALWNRKTKQVRLLLPVRRGLSFTRLIERLPRLLAALGAIEFELIIGEVGQGENAREALTRWAERSKIEIAIFSVPNFRARVHPSEAKDEVADLYYRNNIPDPRILLV